MKIGLKDFPAGRIYVRMDEEFTLRIRDLITKSNPLLSERQKMQLYNLGRGQKVPLMLVKRLADAFSISNESVVEHIDLITSAKNTDVGIRNPRIPLDFNSIYGARLIVAIMGDGELNCNMQIRYNNQDRELINGILACAKNVFGDIDFKCYHRPDNTYVLCFPRIAGLMIVRLGIRPRHKSKANNRIPGFLLTASPGIMAAFLAQFYSDEGNVRLKDRRLQVKQTCICEVDKKMAKENPDMYCANSLLGIRLMLDKLGIASQITLSSYRIMKDGNRTDWELSTYGKENLLAFQKKVGFYMERKNALLDRCINSYKFPSAPRNGRLEYAFRKFQRAEKKDGYVTKHSLAKECQRSVKVATYYLIDLVKTNRIVCADKPRDTNGHFLPRIFRSLP